MKCVVLERFLQMQDLNLKDGLLDFYLPHKCMILIRFLYQYKE